MHAISDAEQPEVIGQALYGWFTANWDGSRGVGFGLVSPSLKRDRSLLSGWAPSEFSDDGGTEPRPNYREVQLGRLVRHGKAVIYCRTPKGQVDGRGRAVTLVHALFGSPSQMSVRTMSRMSNGIWIRHLRGDELPRVLADLTAGELVESTGVLQHSCVNDERLLGRLAVFGSSSTEECVVDDDEALLPDLAELLPSSLSERLVITPRRVDGQQVVILSLADLQSVPSSPGSASRTVASCPVLLAGHEAATRRVGKGEVESLSAWARIALTVLHGPNDDSMKVAPRAESASPQTASRSRTTPDDLRHGVEVLFRSNSAPTAASLAGALRSWVAQGGNARLLLAADGDDVLQRVAGHGLDAAVLRDWFRPFGDVDVAALVAAWNRTSNPLLLGAILVAGSAGSSLGRKPLQPIRVREDVAREVLSAFTSFPGAATVIGRALELGLASSDNAKQVVVEALGSRPGFLFGQVLTHANLDIRTNVDFIRMCQDDWATFHRFAPWEREVIESLFRPSVLKRIADLLHVDLR